MRTITIRYNRGELLSGVMLKYFDVWESAAVFEEQVREELERYIQYVEPGATAEIVFAQSPEPSTSTGFDHKIFNSTLDLISQMVWRRLSWLVG